MSKKLFSFAIIIVTLCTLLTACNNNTSPRDKESVDAQIKLIAEKADLWRHKNEGNIYGTDNLKFCITDLDQNGRLEVINSAIRGTGLTQKVITSRLTTLSQLLSLGTTRLTASRKTFRQISSLTA